MRKMARFGSSSLLLFLVVPAVAVDRISGIQMVPRNEGLTRPADAPLIPGAAIIGNEIRLPKGGVNVELEFIVSGWAEAGDTLFAVQATVDSSGYLGSNAIPSSGLDLVPLGHPANPARGAFQAIRICQNSRRDCSLGTDPCGAGEGVCVSNPRFLLFPVSTNPFLIMTLSTTDYAWGLVIDPVAACLTDPGPDLDPIEYGYVGTLILQVPSGAVGTYEIPLIEHINDSFWLDCNALAPLGFPFEWRSAQITILDCDQDGISDGQEIDDLTVEDCNGNFVPDECELLVDGDGDGAPDVCDGCPDDPLKTQPGVCGCNISEEDLDQNGTPDCVDVIPAASTWGLLVLALLLLAGAKVVFARRVMAA